MSGPYADGFESSIVLAPATSGADTGHGADRVEVGRRRERQRLHSGAVHGEDGVAARRTVQVVDRQVVVGVTRSGDAVERQRAAAADVANLLPARAARAARQPGRPTIVLADDSASYSFGPGGGGVAPSVSPSNTAWAGVPPAWELTKMPASCVLFCADRVAVPTPTVVARPTAAVARPTVEQRCRSGGVVPLPVSCRKIIRRLRSSCA